MVLLLFKIGVRRSNKSQEYVFLQFMIMICPVRAVDVTLGCVFLK